MSSERSNIIDRTFGPLHVQRAGAVWMITLFGREIVCGIGSLSPRHWRIASLRRG